MYRHAVHTPSSSRRRSGFVSGMTHRVQYRIRYSEVDRVGIDFLLLDFIGVIGAGLNPIAPIGRIPQCRAKLYRQADLHYNGGTFREYAA